mmetsp:Transcript_29801/g.62730  ORF Transcript_29801/g.62730 Transcript_29801/m.62730 type:complete len:139 (-) Transcript_29801:363-779(-)
MCCAAQGSRVLSERLLIAPKSFMHPSLWSADWRGVVSLERRQADARKEQRRGVGSESNRCCVKPWQSLTRTRLISASLFPLRQSHGARLSGFVFSSRFAVGTLPLSESGLASLAARDRKHECEAWARALRRASRQHHL